MPLEMAQCARDKLQASAREIWSSIRSFDDGARKSVDSTENAATVSLEKIENVFKVMFGSCTSGAIPSPESEPVTPIKPFEMRSRSARSREHVPSEHIYAALFTEDDQARATRAVDGLRERAASSPPSRSPARQVKDQFATSTPAGVGNGSSVPVAPPTTKAVDVSGDFDFDDGISAISAHTLEELARIHDHKTSFHSKNTLAAHRTSPAEVISHPRSARRSTVPGASPQSPPKTATPSTVPLKFTRGRSNGTHGSKDTKSTKSSSSEFASVWRKEERKYWDDVVQEDKKVDKKTYAMNGSPTKQAFFTKKARRRSRCGSQSTKQDVTVTTASSSSYSNFSSQFDKNHHHPHGVIQYNTRSKLVANPDIFNRDVPITSLDPSRIQNAIAVPYGSELGEI